MTCLRMRISARPVYFTISRERYRAHSLVMQRIPPLSSRASAIFPLSSVNAYSVAGRSLGWSSRYNSSTRNEDVTLGRERWVTVGRRLASTGWFPWRSTISRIERRRKIWDACSNDAARSATFTSPGTVSRARAVASPSSGKLTLSLSLSLSRGILHLAATFDSPPLSARTLPRTHRRRRSPTTLTSRCERGTSMCVIFRRAYFFEQVTADLYWLFRIFYREMWKWSNRCERIHRPVLGFVQPDRNIRFIALKRRIVSCFGICKVKEIIYFCLNTNKLYGLFHTVLMFNL